MKIIVLLIDSLMFISKWCDIHSKTMVGTIDSKKLTLIELEVIIANIFRFCIHILLFFIRHITIITHNLVKVNAVVK